MMGLIGAGNNPMVGIKRTEELPQLREMIWFHKIKGEEL